MVINRNQTGAAIDRPYLNQTKLTTMQMVLIKVSQLKNGNGVNHPEYGYIQYRGLVTESPFSDKPKYPLQYLFWLPVDESGKSRPDIIIMDGNQFVELVDSVTE